MFIFTECNDLLKLLAKHEQCSPKQFIKKYFHDKYEFFEWLYNIDNSNYTIWQLQDMIRNNIEFSKTKPKEALADFWIKDFEGVIWYLHLKENNLNYPAILHPKPRKI